MSDDPNYEPYQALMNFGAKEARRYAEHNIPRLVLSKRFFEMNPWQKDDLEATFKSALNGDRASESRLLNYGATRDEPIRLYVCWLYELLFWIREHPGYLDEVDNILLFGKERAIVTPTPAHTFRETQPQAQSSTTGFFDGLPALVS
jgi:hypothetical protein